MEEDHIDTVYVRIAQENRDQKYDCFEQGHMYHLKRIMGKHSHDVVGWRLHHHKRKGNKSERNLAIALMKSNEEM